MAGFGAKVKLTVDRSSKTEFNKQINDLVSQIKISNKFTVLQKDMDRVRKEAQAMLNNNPITLKVGKIDCSTAVTNVKKQLQAMLSSLSVSNGVNIAGLKDFLGTEGVDAAMRSTADAANTAVQKMNEAKSAAAGWAGQMKVLDSIAKGVSRTYVNATHGNGMIADEEEIQRITAKYNEWIQKVEQVKSVGSGNVEELQREGLAIQRNITAIQNKQAAEAKAAAAAERAARATEEAAKREEEANQAGIASLRQIAGLRERMTKFLQSNSKLSHSDMGDSIRNMLTELNSGATITIDRLKEIEGEFANIRTQAATTKSLGRSMLDALSKAYEKFGGWMIITRSLTAAIHTIKDMVANVREIDNALTQLQIVTGATDAQLTTFLRNAIVLAKNLGKSITDVLSSIETFSRLGYNLADASRLAEFANVLANVAAVDTDEATTGLTSIIKGFNMDVSESEYIADVLIEVGQKYAVSASEMIEAYEKSGAALNATNTSFEKSAGLIAAANASVQNASTVGTALKTISARIRGATADLEDLGEDTSDLAQGFSKYAKEIKALTGFDIIMDGSTDTYKDIYDIFEGISKVWKDLSDTQQARVSEILGGTRQLQVISSILGNWGDAAGAYADAMSSAGAATEANAIYMDSITGRLGVLNATFQEFSNNLLNSGLIKFFVDLGTGIISILNAVEELHLLLPLVISVVVAVKAARVGLAAMHSAVASAETASKINTIVAKLVAEKGATDALAVSVANLTIKEKEELATKFAAAAASEKMTSAEIAQTLSSLGLANAEGTLTIANKTLSTSFKTLMASIPVWGKIAIGVTALITAVTWLSSAFKSNEERLAELNEEYDTLYSTIRNVSSEFKSLKTSADDVIPRFAELAKGVNKFGDNVSLTDEEYAEFLELNNRIAEIFPEINLGMDENSNYMLALSYGADTLTESLYGLLEAQRLVAAQKLADKLPDLVGNVKAQEKVYSKEEQALKNRRAYYQEAYDAYADMFSDDVIGRYKEAYGDNWEAEFNNALEMMGAGWATYIQEAFDVSNNVDSWQRMLDKFSSENGIIDWWGVLNSDEFKNVLAGIERELDNVGNKVQAKWNSINPAVSAWLQTDYIYNDMDEQMQTIVRTMVNGLDFSALGLTTSESIENYITDHIINPLYNSGADIRAAFASITDWQAELKNGKITFDEFSAYIEGVFDDLIRSMSDEDAAAFIENFIAGLHAIDDNVDDFDDAINSIINNWGDVIGAVFGSKNAATVIDDLTEKTTDLKKAYNLLKTARDEMAGGEGLSADTIAELAVAEKNYLDYLYEENGVIKLNTDAWKKNVDAKMLGDISKIKQETFALNDRNIALRESVSALIAERNAHGDSDGSLTKQIQETIDEINRNSDAIRENQDLLRFYTTIYQQIAGDGNAAFGSLTNALTAITEQYDLLNKAQEEFTKSGVLSASILSSIVAKYPEMQQSVDLYIAGMKSEKELLADLSAAYGVDLRNYRNTVLKKMEISTEFYNSLTDDQKKLIDELSESYGIDLKNFQTIESKKLEFQAQIIKNLASNYSKYTNASVEGLKSQQDAMLIHGGYDPKEMEALSNAIKAIDRYNYSISHIAVGANLVSSWNPEKFNTSGSSSSSASNSDTKKIEEYTVEIDKYREAIERLDRVQEKREGLETWLSNAKSLEEEIELRNELIDTYKQEQAALHALNDLRDQTISENVDKLRGMGFEIEYDPDQNHLFIKNLEHINELVANGKGEYESVQEATNAYRKEVEELVSATEDLNKANKDGSSSWRDRYYDKRDKIVEQYQSRINDRNNKITLTQNWLDNSSTNHELNNVERYTDELIAHYKVKQQEMHDLAEYYRSKGYSDTSDEITELSDAWWECEDNIRAAKQQMVDYLMDIVSATSSAVDGLQNVYQTLLDAADEYAKSGGFISIDAYQSILDLGPQYMQYLRDENGLLVINEERIQAAITAKTRQLALDNAMTYVERLKLALQKNSIEDLDELLFATEKASGATWDLVYANLALLGLSDDQYEAALHNINAIRDIGEIAVNSIGKEVGAAESGFDSILNYVMDMLKQQVQDEIDALNEMKRAYGEIIDQRKAALDSAKKEADYEKDKASKLKEITKLQAKIDALSLDNSREAQAEKAKRQEELAQLQEELSDTQTDYAIENQKSALDEMKDAYDEEKDGEIKTLEDSISSQQKLYEKAVDYIKFYWENSWDDLKAELLQWNYDVGNSLETEITSAWDNCTRYIKNNPLGIDGIFNSGSDTGSSSSAGGASAGNSNGSNKIIGTTLDYRVSALVTRMKQNSADWHSVDKTRQAELNAENREYAAQIGEIIGQNLTLGRDGVWYLPDGRKLYDVYGGKYHTGGTVGAIPTPKQNEIIATLERGEIVLDKQKQDNLYRIINLLTAASDRIDAVFRDNSLSNVLVSAQSGLNSSLGNVTNNRQETIHFGDVYIYGGSEETVAKHREVTRQFTNEVLRQLNIRQ